MRPPARPTPLVAALLLAAALAGPARAAAQSPVVYYPGRWRLTQYWIAEERCGTDDRRPVRVQARDGRTLAWTCPTFLADLAMEGTGRTWDGRLLNWDARIDGVPTFLEVDRDAYPYGIGVAGYALVPYRSLAVDRRFIPVGHTVEMADLAGMPLPDGSRHDGCFVAVDGGGAIHGHHIDLFVPTAAAYRELARAGHLPTHVRQVVLDAPRCAYARRYAILPDPGQPTLPR